MKGIRIYYSQSVKLAYKWVNRRSQKKSFNWEKYRRLIYEWNPLPQPKIYHLTYTLSSLKKISAAERISITDLVDKLVDEHERSFWKGFEKESRVFLDKEETKTRKIFEKALGDGIETRKAAKIQLYDATR